MRNLIPHYILDRYLSGNNRGRLPVVGMFVDISGFSQITDQLMEQGQHGAEILADVMRNIFTPLVQITYEHGGFISTLAGDAFTAIYPIEDNDEIVCLHALSAAWQIQKKLESLAKQTTPYGEFLVSGRIGIAKGEAAWGVVNSQDQRRAAYYIEGSAVEESALSEGKASSGQIIADANFRDAIGGHADFSPQEDYFMVSSLTVDPLPPLPVDLNIQDSEMAYRFFPRSLFHQVHSGEFRQVVTMFINLPTVRTEDQLAIFMGTLFELQDKFGGLLTRLDFGDKGSNLLMFWGAPVSFENDIERALNLILELQTQTSIPINAGVTYRIAHAGFIGSPLREEYTAYGRGVNLAARFMSTAQRGEIWVDEEIARRASSRFEIEPDGEYPFKGFSRKQKVYLLEERKEEVERTYQTELVGRQSELEALANFIGPISEVKYCGAMMVLGDPGIGKTRLVDEFSNQVESDIHWSICQCDQAIRDSFNPFRYWLRNYFSISTYQNEARNKRNFNRKIDQLITSIGDKKLAAELDRTRSFLGALNDLYWPDSLYQQVDPQGRYDNTIIGLISLIQAECTNQPLILQLEDAQWLDEDSWTLLTRLDRSIKSDLEKSFPLAIIGTARFEFLSTGLKDGINFQELRIGDLSPDSLNSIAEQLFGGPASRELLELLNERSEGNPFFAEQIGYYLLEEEKLRIVDGEWKIKDPSQSPLPDDIRALLVSRIDRLTEDVKDVVLSAAVLGREFELQILSFMLDGDSSLAVKVADAEQNAIWSKMGELRYLFTHALLLDAAYRMQTHSRRQVLHKSAVAAIENLYSEDIGSYTADLAYHCEKAGLVEKARDHLLDAANTAKGEYRNAHAIDLLSRALNLTSDEDFETKFEILLERGEIFAYQGQLEEQRTDLESLDNMLKTTEESLIKSQYNVYQSEIAIKWADHYVEVGQYEQTIEITQKIISSAEETNIPNNLVDAFFFWAISLFQQGHYEDAEQKGIIGLTHANSVDDLDGEIRILNLLGLIALVTDKSNKAQDYFLRSLGMAEKVGNLRDQARALNNLGNLSLSGGNFNSAKDYYLRSLTFVRKIGDLPREGLVLSNIGYIAGVQGDYIKAKDYYDRSLLNVRQVGDRVQEAYGLINSSSIYRALNEFTQALSLARLGLSITQETGDRNWEAWAFTSLGHTLFEIGNLEEAAESYKNAVDLRSSMQQENLVCEPLAGLARIALQKADLGEALTYINPILEYLEKGGTFEGTDEPIRVYLTCYQVLRDGEDPRANDILQAGYRLLQTRGDGIKNDVMRNEFYNNIPHNKELLSEWNSIQE